MINGTYSTPRLEIGEALMQFAADDNTFIAQKALPVFNTAKKAAKFPMVTRESLMQSHSAKRVAGAAYGRVDLGTEEGSFDCEEYGLEGPLDDGQRELYKSDFDAGFAISKKLWYDVMLSYERRVSTLLFNTTTWTGSSLYLDTSNVWSTTTTDIIGDVLTACSNVRSNCGMQPNTLIVSRTVLDSIVKNDAIRNGIQYNLIPDYEVVKQKIAGIMGLKQVLVGEAMYNSATENAAFSSSSIWSSSYAMVALLAEDNSPITNPSVGRSFAWEGDAGLIAVESYRDEPKRSEVYRVRQFLDEIVIDSSYGFLLKVD